MHYLIKNLDVTVHTYTHTHKRTACKYGVNSRDEKDPTKHRLLMIIEKQES